MNSDHVIIKNFPKIEFSYETIYHKKIPSNYNLCIAIPHAKKHIFWSTIYQNDPVSILLELNRNKQISNFSIIDTCLNSSKLSLGTILSGSLLVAPEKQLFIIDEIYTYAGKNLKKLVFGLKLDYIHEILRVQDLGPKKSFVLFLPVFWSSHDNNETSNIPLEKIPYPLHHIQYRSLTTILPYFNVFLDNGGTFPWKMKADSISTKIPSTNIHPKQKQEHRTTYLTNDRKYFDVKADLQNDIYHLYASGNIYYDMAYIPNIKSSVYMNSLFRNIKENKNLDLLEESDEEDDFEDERPHKFVDLDKTIVMECVYHNVFQRWVPIKVISCQNVGIVNIENLPIKISNLIT